MSIVAEIRRLQKAKTDIKAVIEKKGVDVGDGLIDTYAEKMAELPAVDEDYRTIFWDGFQQSGEKTDYSNAFRNWKKAHNYWTPAYDINHTNGSMVFYGFTSDVGLPELCKRAGITMDWSKVATFAQTFSYATIPDVGVIDTRGASTLASILAYSNVKKAHLILKNDGSQGVYGAFAGATALTDLTIEGFLGDNVSIPSHLTPTSMISVITHLANYKNTEKEMLCTLTCSDASWNDLEVYSSAPGGGTWKNYVKNVLGWNV